MDGAVAGVDGRVEEFVEVGGDVGIVVAGEGLHAADMALPRGGEFEGARYLQFVGETKT